MGGLPSNMKIQPSQNQTCEGRAEQSAKKHRHFDGSKGPHVLALNFNNYSRSKQRPKALDIFALGTLGL